MIELPWLSYYREVWMTMGFIYYIKVKGSLYEKSIM